MKPKKPPLLRIWCACIYSKDGLIAAFKGEAAFRQELLLFTILLIPIYLLPLPFILKLLLLTAHTIVLIAELGNSAIEAVVDHISPEFSEMAKKAKDMGSAAVFLSLVLCAVLWISALARYLL